MPYSNYNWITERLAIGGVVSEPETLPFDAILSLMTEAPASLRDIVSSGAVEYRWFSIIDGYSFEEHDEIVRRFDAAAAQIDRWLSAGKRVLVHCYAGVSRSVTAVVWYFVRYQEKSWDEAMEMIRASRTVARPNVRFEIPLRLAAGEDLSEEWMSDRVRWYCERVLADDNFSIDPEEILGDLQRQGTTVWTRREAMSEERERAPEDQNSPPQYTAPTDPDMDTGTVQANGENTSDAERLGEDVQQTLNRH